MSTLNITVVQNLRLRFWVVCFLVQWSSILAQDIQHPEKYVHLYDVAYQYPYPRRWELLDSVRTHLFDTLKTKEGYLFRSRIEEIAAEQHKDEMAMLIAQLSIMDYLQRSSRVPIEAFDLWYKKNMAEADRLNFTEMKAKITFLYAANLKHNYQKDVLSLYYLNKSAEYVYPSKGFTDLQKSFIFSGLSRIYYQFDDFTRAIQFGKEVEKRVGNKTETFLTLDVMATCYFKLQKYDSALVYFDKSLRMLHSEFGNDKGKRGWHGILIGQKGHVYKATNEWDEAIRNYQIGIEDTYKNNLWDNTCGFAINLADIYLTKNQLSEAAKLIPIARQTTQSSGNELDKFQLHELLMKYYTLSGQINLILPHKDSAQYWSAVLEKRRGKNVQIQADLRLETERRLHLETSLNESIKQQQINRIITIVIVGLLTVIAVVLVLRYQLLVKLKDKELKIQKQAAEKKLLLEQEKARQEQLIAQLKLEEFTNIIIAKNKQIELLLSENDEAQTTASIQQLQHNIILTEEQWLSFKELFEQVHTGYLQRLKEKIPSISPAEIRFMALAKLQLNTREMASSLGVSVNAVRNVWFRLRKRVNLPDEATWQNMANEI